MPNPKIKTMRPDEQASVSFASYGDDGPDRALASRCLEESGAVERSFAGRDRFAGIEPGISVRDTIGRNSQNFFRPGEHIPRRKNEIILASDDIYRFNGIVHYVIDMMADFVTQGIKVHHTSTKLEKFYRAWWKKVGGTMVSERLVNLLYRHGVDVIKRTYGTMDEEDVKDLHLGVAVRKDNETDFERSINPGRNRIPLQYTFLNPLMVELLGGDLAMFSGNAQYGLRIPDPIIKAIKSPKNDYERQAVSDIPLYITQVVGAGGKVVPLDREKVSVLFYKKDDWQAWSDPLILSVMKDIILYDKMKSADGAALDGSISRKTLWKLGLPEYKIQPGPAAMKRLRDQLLASVGGASQDLIWDASLNFQETSTEVHKFLGSAKYEPVLQAIYAGLGIPQSLTGGGHSGGMTNNALSLKTLIERLTYARNVLIDFWERELYQIQRAMGHRKPALLAFDMMSFSDEASEKQLWMGLWDRDVASLETIRERFGMIPEIETKRVKAEYEQRESGNLPYKTGPFTEAVPHPDGLAKAAMLQGTVAPTEAGVKKKPKAKGDRSLLDRQEAQQDKTLDLQKQQAEVQQGREADVHNQQLSQNDDLHKQKLKQQDTEHKAMLPVKKKALQQTLKQKAKGQPGQGRPTGQKDQNPRKTRTPKVAQVVATQVYAREAQRTISDLATPIFLSRCNKKNLRGLSASEADELETLKFGLLCSLEPGQSFGAEWVEEQIDQPPAPVPAFSECLSELEFESYGSRSKQAGYEERRELMAFAYACIHTQDNQEADDGEA